MKILRKWKLENIKSFKWINTIELVEYADIFESKFTSRLYDHPDHHLAFNLKRLKQIVRDDLCDRGEPRMKWIEVELTSKEINR